MNVHEPRTRGKGAQGFPRAHHKVSRQRRKGWRFRVRRNAYRGAR